MLLSTFSPLIPTNESEHFYINFYNQFCFIQVNDYFLTYLKDSLSEGEKHDLLKLLNNYHEDQTIAAVFCIGTGIINPALMRKQKENRGISIKLFESLENQNIDPLEWYQKSFEFLMVYATCEQALKEYLISQSISSTSIKEDTLLNKLFEVLSQNNLKNNFITELIDGSSSIIASQNELISVWKYFTLFRHTLIHSGGRITNRIKEKIADLISKNKKELTTISSSLYIESLEDNFFASSPFEREIIFITDKQLSFFRNLAILIVESLERAIHPNEHKIKILNPYTF